MLKPQSKQPVTRSPSRSSTNYHDKVRKKSKTDLIHALPSTTAGAIIESVLWLSYLDPSRLLTMINHWYSIKILD
jgi:hypothetical protein